MTIKNLRHKASGTLIMSALLFGTDLAGANDNLSHNLTSRSAVAQQLFYLGSWTGERQGPRFQAPAYPSQGIVSVRLNADGSMRPLALTPSESPSWLTLNREGTRLYAVNEIEQGEVSAYRVLEGGKLALINRQPSAGEHPTHASLTPDGRFLLVANYSGSGERAGVAVLPIAEDGQLQAVQQYFAYQQGSNKIADRQASGHAHSVTISPSGEWLLAADLGADMLRVYRYQADSPQPFTAFSAGDIKLPAGSGPRHSKFSADGRYLYLTSEMSATISVYQFAEGKAKLLQQLPLTQSQDAEEKSGAGLILSPDQRFLYVGNRGTRNEIIAYQRDLNSGQLSDPKVYSAGGVEPRELALDNSGHYLLVSNVYSNNVVQFMRDKQSGALRPTGVTLGFGTPTQVLFSPQA